jgi:hypothetical protein
MEWSMVGYMVVGWGHVTPWSKFVSLILDVRPSNSTRLKGYDFTLLTTMLTAALCRSNYHKYIDRHSRFRLDRSINREDRQKTV